MTLAAIDTAAWGCVVGCDGLALLTCDDDLEGRLRVAVIARAVELRRRLSHHDAIEIANAVGQLIRS